MAVPPQNNDAFLREVDEELRREHFATFWKRWGVWLIGAVIAALVVFGGWLFWQHYRQSSSAEVGGQMTEALESVAANNTAAAAPVLAELVDTSIAGYRSSALFSRANLALGRGDLKAAAADFAKVAADSDQPKPVRDLALIRQTYAEFDTMKPDAVLARLQPLAVKGNPWFGSAGELVAAAYLRMNQPEPAAKLYGAIAQDETVPESLRKRSVQMAGVLGVDALNQSKAMGSNAVAANASVEVKDGKSK